MAIFSVIIPTKNRHGLLREAIGSVLAQSLKQIEIIVVDDGEGAAAAIASLSDRIKVLDNRGLGPVRARNFGVQQAKGDFIAFLDDDDWWTDRLHLERAAGLLRGSAEFVFGDGMMVFESGAKSIPFSRHADADTLARDNTILISAVCYRRSLHATLGPFDESLTDYWDWDWYLRVARSGAKLHHLRSPAVSIRVHDRNMSGEEREAERRAGLDLLSAKHGLGALPLKNHVQIAKENR